MSGFIAQTESSFIIGEFNESWSPTSYDSKALAKFVTKLEHFLPNH